jgi:sn-glycerol 3-phosphate transport system ATP-binding protein
VQMRVEIKKLQQSLATTSIYVTHDQVEAMTLADRLIVMNAGLAEQIGPPIELYERPASVFVAGFIGSPAMNFLSGRTADGHVLLDGGAALPLPPGSTAAPGSAVTVGMRPEHFAADGEGAQMSLVVDLVEMLGADTIVHGRIEGAGPSVLARLPGTARAAAGQRVELTIAKEQIHLFDAATGKRV